MADADKILMGSSLSLMEVEEDDDDRDILEETNFRYCCLEILNHIGKEDFKNIYLLLIPEIRSAVTDEQLTFARDILSKIEEVYQFNFTNILMETDDDTEQVFKLLEFLEYDNLDFLVDLFSYLKEDPLKVKDIEFLLEMNKEKIDQYTNTLTHQANKMILELVRTYNWDDFKRYLNKIVEKNKIEITLELRMKGELKK